MLRSHASITVMLLQSLCSVNASSNPLAADLARAQQRIPRDDWKGHNFKAMNEQLNRHLHKSGNAVRDCSEWSYAELQQLQELIFKNAEPELLAIYANVGDNRQQRFKTFDALKEHWAAVDMAVAKVDGLDAIRRDGLCHETVMWWVHHLTSPVQKHLTGDGLILPSLPNRKHIRILHGEGKEEVAAQQKVFQEYESQVSCQQCHTGNIVQKFWQNATLDPPLPADEKHPGRERQWECNYQYNPPCGPCEGLGGRRWGDGPKNHYENMTPIKCEVIRGAKQTTKGRFPPLAIAKLTGETRQPTVVRMREAGKYFPVNGTLALGWHDDIMAMQYDFPMGTMTSMQTLQQSKKMDVGATIEAFNGQCTCVEAIAGVMHINSFDPLDPLDPLKLPPEEGGATYLGTVRVVLDGDNPDTNGTVAIADHYMKWAFHFLVDANPNSSSFGLPLRLYGATGVRFVYDSWKIGDPVKTHPDIWKMPKGCNITVPECSIFDNASGLPQSIVI